VLLLSTATTVNADSFQLIADGGEPPGINVGYLDVSNDGSSLYVDFFVDGSWILVESHVHVATTMDGVPQKNGNPIPGKFQYSDTDGMYDIPLTWGAGTSLCIAAYAVVANPETIIVVSDQTDKWTAGEIGDIDGSGCVVPPAEPIWTAAVFCWEHSSWNTSLKPASLKTKLFTAPAADWIWGPVVEPDKKISNGASYTGGIVFFKKQIEIPESAYGIQAELTKTTDNAYYLYVNDADWSGVPAGKAGFMTFYGPTNFYYISDGINNLGGGTNSVPYETAGNIYPSDVAIDTNTNAWSTIEQWNISSYLNPGQNELQIVGINEHAAPEGPGNNPAGLIYKAEINYLFDETAWGEGPGFPGKNWAMYFTYTV